MYGPPCVGDIAMATEETNKMDAEPSEVSDPSADAEPLEADSSAKLDPSEPLGNVDPWETTEVDPWASDDPSASAQFWSTTGKYI